MKEITNNDYKKFIKNHKKVTIEDVDLEIGQPKKIQELQPKDFVPETSTTWSFPNRGNWATHYLNSRYRGNWAPEIPRNLILKYTREGETVLDQMSGSGTTMIECKLLGRNGIAVDINEEAIMIALDRLDFNTLAKLPHSKIRTFVGDARNLDKIEDNSIDLIATHPPYVSIIPYTNQKVEGDLSNIRNVGEFLEEMKKVASECFRVLKPGKYCAVLIGDTRRHQHYIPIAPRLMQTFLDVGFILKENIIKAQHKMKSTREKWNGKYDFYLIAHENLFVFRKPTKDEKVNGFKESMKWW